MTSAPHRIDLDAYLQRIGLTGVLSPTLATLQQLAAAHAALIPFENLNPFLGLPVSLDPAAVEQKVVHEGRGGYCFEQNLLFRHALSAIGFDVLGLAARVLWMQPEDAITPRSHMLLRVELDGATYLADAGFGGLTLTGVLRLEADVEQATPHEPFRLLRADGDWRMQALVRDEWRTLYRFDLQPQFPPDYEVTNYYLSTNPASHFVTGLIAARALSDRRLALRNRDFAIHHASGETERRVLQTPSNIVETLHREFGIDLAGLTPALLAKLETLP